MQYNSTVAKSGANTLSGFTGRSTGDYSGSVDIRVVGMQAHRAPEGRLVGSVLFRDVAALRAFPRGIVRIDKNQRHSVHCRFVSDKQPQLRKSPTMENCSLLAPNCNPVANTTQLFELDSAICAFSVSNNLFTDYVICVTGKPLLLARQFLQSALGRSRLLLLKLGPQPTMPVTNRLDFGTAISFAVGGRGNIGYSEIHPQELRRSQGHITRKVYRAEQIKLPVSVNQIGLPFDPIKALPLIFAVNQGNYHALLGQSPQANPVDTLKSHNALVIGDRAVRLEDRANRLIPRKTLDRFADGANSHLCRQPKPGANFGVSKLVNRGLAENTSIESLASGECGRFVDPLHRFEQSLTLCRVRQQLQLERQLHVTRKANGIYG
jgi:hypothetical protein